MRGVLFALGVEELASVRLIQRRPDDMRCACVAHGQGEAVDLVTLLGGRFGVAPRGVENSGADVQADSLAV